ncbi:TonB-dependent receptor [Parahaliea mediterranea]|uniref:TonB-dependent receptor n=1 Tax=Parahaliea mediterranea TaxID=651086 RepID=A0A939DGV9_9GAMM|nr:TonB-dependent receptor [Parahaliea mediterranea]MBN7797818.1 TonB-dependent receptor [Parahaliea mediterranea]
MMRKPLITAIAAQVSVMALAVSAPALGQNRGSGVSALIEEVVITARKREENMQDVPVAVSAVSSDQMAALKIRTLTDVYRGMPNVELKENGTVKGTANYVIRGIGALSSVPGVDPAVGVFYDGVYLGQNNGLVSQAFDLESVQVLRGPQGHLFGKNTTAGAVLLTTRKPTPDFEASVRTSLEGNPNGSGGLNRHTMGMVNLPVSDTLASRFVAYYNDDEGYFENAYNGENIGESRTKMVRGSLMWTPTDSFDATVTYEYQDSDGDGSVGHTFDPGDSPVGGVTTGAPPSFIPLVCGFTPSYDDKKICQNEHGFDQRIVNNLNITAKWDVGFGDGTVTNIFGWRDMDQDTLIDYDSQAVTDELAGQLVAPGVPGELVSVNAYSYNQYEQLSNEIRYVGSFGDVNLTAGLYYFTNETRYTERRDILGVPASGGGIHEVESISGYSEVEWYLDDKWALTLGLNISHDSKEADVAIIQVANGTCDVRRNECAIDYSDSYSNTNYSPKLGLSYQYLENTLLYAQVAQSYRSGLYSLRNTYSPAELGKLTPGPTDVERTDGFELGFKSGLGGRGKLNGAFFYNYTKNLARIVETTVPPLGNYPLARSVGNTQSWGVELDLSWSLTNSLVLLASLGYLDTEYDEVNINLENAQGQDPEADIVDDFDRGLTPVMSPEWTGKIGLNHSLDLGDWGTMDSRLSWAYRSEVFEYENNSFEVPSQEQVDAGIDFNSHDGQWSVGIYGKNLLDETYHGGINAFLAPFNGTYSPAATGRVLGAEVTYYF